MAPKPTIMYITKVRAVPLNAELQTNVDDIGTDYILRFNKGMKVQFEGDLFPRYLRDIALGAFRGSPLSYKYRKGHRTFFEVTYKYGSKGSPYLFGFVSGEGG
jgi:hypothetical protein